MGYSCLVRTLDWSNCDGCDCAASCPACSLDFPCLPLAHPRRRPLTISRRPPAILRRSRGAASSRFCGQTLFSPPIRTALLCATTRNPLPISPARSGPTNCPRWFRAGSSKAFRTRICYARSAGPACSPISISRPAYGGSNWIRRKARQSSKSPRKSLAKADASLPGAYFPALFQWRRANRRWSPRARRGACPSHARHRHLDRAENLTRFQERTMRLPITASIVLGPRLAHVLRKLLDFYDMDMLQRFESERFLFDRVSPGNRTFFK